MTPSIVPPAASARAINNDGANQGWYYGNVIYGGVDLDFHGHHHSAGFFSPTSHYHGSKADVAYMRSGSTCTATDASVNPTLANGPYKDYPSDNDIHVLGQVVVAQADARPCLPHMDHGKRWTSVFFNDNLVVDPNGLGLRFEDRDHRGDDEKANSENMLELKKPHFHQKWVQLEDNTVVGKVFIDVLNAPGTKLWNDNWAAVANPAGPARTQEALQHPGAEIVSSHPYRNDAWLDIQDNTVFATQSTGILVREADDLTRFQLKDNTGLAFPRSLANPPTAANLLQWLKDSADAAPGTLVSDMAAWNGQDRGVQTFALLAGVQDRFTVEHCGNVARGLDRGLIATERIYDDGESIIQACGTNDWGAADPGVQITYTPAPVAPTPCTDQLRAQTAGTDDFYATELVFDTVDPVGPAAPAAVCGSI